MPHRTVFGEDMICDRGEACDDGIEQLNEVQTSIYHVGENSEGYSEDAGPSRHLQCNTESFERTTAKLELINPMLPHLCAQWLVVLLSIVKSGIANAARSESGRNEGRETTR
jgi:hypothetical protein